MATRKKPASNGDQLDPQRGVYMISVAAELAGMHPQTLRIYETRGLITPQRSSGNTRLTKLYRGLVKEFQLFRVHAIVQQGSLLASNQEHREIVLALKAGDASLSWRISSGHVEHGKQRMLAALETVGGSEAATTPQAPRRRREEQDQR